MMTARLRPVVVGAACALTVVAWVLWWRNGSRIVVEDTTYLLLAFTAVTVGEVWRTSLSTRPVAPLSTAAAIGLALAPIGAEQRPLRAAQVLVVVAAAMALGTIFRTVTGLDVGVVDTAARLVGVGVTIALTRVLTVGGLPLLTWWQAPGTPRWLGALALVGAAAVGVFVELAAWTATSWDRRIPIRRLVEEDVLQAGGLGSAMTHAGPLVALATPVAGPAALPIVLFPLAVSMIALRRKAATEATYRETVIALSRLTDDTGHTCPGHARRVADLAMTIARVLEQPERDVARLEEAALLHDVGQVTLPIPIPGGATVLVDPDSQRRIAADSVRILHQAGVSEPVGRTIEASVQPFRVMRELGETIPLAARILKVANAYDDLTGGATASGRRADALERINLGLGYEYDPVCVGALAEATKTPPTSGGGRLGDR
jgi:hypothetical protein